MAQGWEHYNALRMDQAKDVFQSLVDKDPSNYEARLALARTYIRMRREDDAYEQAEACARMQPERAEAYTCQGMVRFLQDDLDEARDRLQQAILLDPDDPEPYLTLAQVMTDLKLYAESAAELQTARKLVAHITDDNQRRQLEASELHARTYVLLNQNKVPEAMAIAKELAEYEDETPYAACLAYSNLGLMEARLKHYDKSIEYLEKAYAMNPYFYRAGSALGRIYLVRGVVTKAAEVLGTVVANSPEVDAHTRHAYAASLAKIGRRAEAIEQYRTALQAGLKGLERLMACWQLVWLSNVGRLVVIALALAALAAWLIFGKPDGSTLAFVAVLLILFVMQRLLGRKRYH